MAPGYGSSPGLIPGLSNFAIGALAVLGVIVIVGAGLGIGLGLGLRNSSKYKTNAYDCMDIWLYIIDYVHVHV